MDYVRRGTNYQYACESMPIEGLGNKKIDIDGNSLQLNQSLESIKRVTWL